MREFAHRAIRFSLQISLLLSGITLLFYAYLGKNIRMIADDYCTAYRGLLHGVWDGVLQTYQTWASQPSNFAIKYAFAGIQPEIHPWMGLITVILSYCAFHYAVSRIFIWLKVAKSFIFTVLLSIILCFVFYRIFPSYQHAWWFAAVIPYTWSILALIFFIASFAHYWQAQRNFAEFVFMGLYSFIAVLIITGFVETMITFVGAIFGLCLLASPFVPIAKRRGWMLLISCVLLACIFALGIALSSPGANARREAILGTVDSNSISMLSALLEGQVYTALYFFGEPFGYAFGQTVALGFLGFLFAFIFFGGLVILPTDYQLPAPKNLGFTALIVLVIAYLLTYSLITPIYYSAGAVVIRPLIAARFTQMLMVLVWSYLAVAAYQRHHLQVKLRRSKVFPLVLLASAFLLIWTPAFSIYRLLEIVPDLERYASSWDERHAYLSSQEGEALVFVEPLVYDIEDLLVLDIMQGEDGYSEQMWVNACVANYYHIDEVFVMEDKANN